MRGLWGRQQRNTNRRRVAISKVPGGSPSEGHNPPQGSAGVRGIFRGFSGVVTLCL